MRRPVPIEEFARLVDFSVEDIERYRDLRLLELDGDALFDDLDVLRLRIMQIMLDRGEPLEDLAHSIKTGAKADAWGFSDTLWPRGETATVEEAARQLEMTTDQLQAIRTAIGLPGIGLLEKDFEVLRGVKTMVDGGFPFEAVLEGARVLGDAMRRFAQTEVRLTDTYLNEPLRASGMPERDVARQVQDVIDTAIRTAIEPIILEVHRQYLLRALLEDVVGRLEAAERQSPPGTIEVAILFVDLSSFTPLTYLHGDQMAAEVIDRFEGLVRTLVLDHRGMLVKQIGDEFMLAFRHTADSLSFALALDQAVQREESFPAIRIGIHAGPVIFRTGDYVGNTVNIASRITSAVAPGEIVFTEVVAGVAEKAEIPVEEVGMRLLRGVSDPLKLFRVIRDREREKSRDPVCGMLVGEEAFGRLQWSGVEHAFCSEDCLRRFLAEPAKYATA